MESPRIWRATKTPSGWFQTCHSGSCLNSDHDPTPRFGIPILIYS